MAGPLSVSLPPSVMPAGDLCWVQSGPVDGKHSGLPPLQEQCRTRVSSGRVATEARPASVQSSGSSSWAGLGWVSGEGHL